MVGSLRWSGKRLHVAGRWASWEDGRHPALDCSGRIYFGSGAHVTAVFSDSKAKDPRDVVRPHSAFGMLRDSGPESSWPSFKSLLTGR